MKAPPPQKKTNDSKDEEGFIHVVYLFGYFLQSASNANSYCILSPFAAQKTRLLGHVGSKFQGILALLGPQHEIIQKKILFVCVLCSCLCVYARLYFILFLDLFLKFSRFLFFAKFIFLIALFSFVLFFFFVQNS